MFKSGTGASANPIAYKEDTPSAVDGKPVNGNYTLNLRFLRKINGEELKNIDLYILANSESTNMADKLNGKNLRSITRADLQKATNDSELQQKARLRLQWFQPARVSLFPVPLPI